MINEANHFIYIGRLHAITTWKITNPCHLENQFLCDRFFVSGENQV